MIGMNSILARDIAARWVQSKVNPAASTPTPRLLHSSPVLAQVFIHPFGNHPLQQRMRKTEPADVVSDALDCGWRWPACKAVVGVHVGGVGRGRFNEVSRLRWWVA